MSRHQKNPLRSLTPEEQQYLEKVSRCQSESAGRVARAKILLAVAEGDKYTDAARSVGRRSGDAVALLVARFNQEGMAALNCRHGGGPRIVYGSEQRSKILQAVQRQPERLTDGTATWSSGGDNRLKRLVELGFHPLESSKDISLLRGLLRIDLAADLFSIMIIIWVGGGWARYTSPTLRSFLFRSRRLT